MSSKERLLEFLRYIKMGQTAFEEKVGLTRGYISKVKKAIGPEIATKIATAYPELNINWLITGEGKMLKDETVFIEHTDEIDYTRLSGSLVYNIDGTCGPVSRSLEDKAYIIGAINLPGFDRDMPVVQAKEDSMIPRINPNDYVGIQRVFGWDIIYWGKMHFVVMEDYRMFKILKKCKEDSECVILKSVNEDYDDIKVKKSDIVELYIVKKVLSLKTEVM